MRQIKIRIRHDIYPSRPSGNGWTDAVYLTLRAWRREVWNECGDGPDTSTHESVVGDGTVKFIQDKPHASDINVICSSTYNSISSVPSAMRIIAEGISILIYLSQVCGGGQKEI